MREILTDIRNKLSANAYENEEHVRLSLVCRLLHKLGWNIWNPGEVNTEFIVIPDEDKKKVDIALFANELSPSIFVEVKAVGKLYQNLTKVEQQVRDYNKNNTALFSVLTDGRGWRFYYSQTGGAFPAKCFKVCDLINDDLEDIENTFSLFLSIESIKESGPAKEQAGKYLQLTNKQKTVQDLVPQARRLVDVRPYPSLLEAIVGLAKDKGFDLFKDEVADILAQMPPPPPPPGPPITQDLNNGRLLKADNLGDLRFTRVEGTIDGKQAKGWKSLVDIAITLAVQSNNDVSTWNAYLPANIKEGCHINEGYTPMKALNLSVQGMNANNSATTLLLIAKKLNYQLELTVSWHGKSPQAGEQDVIRWPSA